MSGIGIIGTGWGARVQVPAFRAAGLSVIGLAGSSAEKTARIGAELGVPFTTGDWRALLQRDDVTFVSIVTPPSLHREMALATLAAGKHVLCEKPTAMDVFEAEIMLAAARERPTQLALIDHELRFLPALREARRLVSVGAIGTVRYVDSKLISSGRADTQRPWSWWSDASQGGGVLGAIGSHQIDSVRYLLADEVASARGLVHTFIDERPDGEGRQQVTSDDFCAYQLRMGSGALVSATANLVAHTDEPSSLTLYGSEGTLRFSAGRLLFGTSGGQLSDITPDHSAPIPPEISGDFPEATIYLAQALVAALAGDHAALEPAATFADGLAIQRTIDAIRASSDQGWESIEH